MVDEGKDTPVQGEPSEGGGARTAAAQRPPVEKYGAPLTASEMDAVLAASGIGAAGVSAAAAESTAAHRPPGRSREIAEPFLPEDLGSAGAAPDGAAGIDLLSDVTLDVTVELGRSRMLVEDVLRLGNGSVVELDRLAGDPVDVYVNERLVARGEVLVLNDDFCVRISEIVTPPDENGAAR